VLTILSLLLGATLYLNFFYLAAFLMRLFAGRAVPQQWGVVYDAVTKNPVEKAIVRIFDAAGRRLIQTRITDKFGRFGFVIPSGQYQIKAINPEYLFPSIIIQHHTKIDGLYSNLYFGGPLNLDQAKIKFLNVNIPLDPLLTSQSRSRVKAQKMWLWSLRGLLLRLRQVIKKIVLPIYVVALILGVVTYLDHPNVASIVFYIMIGCLLLKEIEDRSRKNYWGKVYDTTTKQPVKLAQVAIYDAEYRKVREIRYTDLSGQYSFMIPKGEYYLKVQIAAHVFPSKIIKSKSDRGYQHLYHGEIFKLNQDGEMLDLNIPIDPVR
jgi:hypothetical protein